MVSSPSLSFSFKCRCGTGVFDWLDLKCTICYYISSIALVHLKKKSNFGLFVRKFGFIQRINLTSTECHAYFLCVGAMACNQHDPLLNLSKSYLPSSKRLSNILHSTGLWNCYKDLIISYGDCYSMTFVSTGYTIKPYQAPGTIFWAVL